MKKIKICFILLLLFGFTSAFAQGTRSATADNTRAAKTLEDPKLSPEEQALLLTAGEDNPAKIDASTMVDPRLTPEEMATDKDFGVSNARPAEDLAEETRPEPEPAQQAVATSDDTQPEGNKAGTITDFRNLNDSGDQPQGEQPKNVLNLRDMKGSDEQPAGNTPKK